MKKTLIWIGVSLPWIAGTLLLAAFCAQEYSRGRNFVPGFHFFGWMGNMIRGAYIYLPALLVAGTAAICFRKQIKGSRPLMLTAGVSAVSLLIPFAAMFAMSHCFFAGREAAYESLDYEAIYKASMQLRKRVVSSGADFVYWERQETPAALPAEIARLSPLEVTATADAVFIQMDGGGPMYHEGIGIVFVEKGSCSLRQAGIRPLHDSLPVYLFRVDDYRGFFDAVRESEQGTAADGEGGRG